MSISIELLTSDCLLEILTPKQAQLMPELNNIRLSKNIYDIRVKILREKLTHIIDILKTNYWATLENYVLKMSKITLGNPIGFIIHIRNHGDNDSNVLSEYLLTIYSLRSGIQQLESRVENNIEYEELEY